MPYIPYMMISSDDDDDDDDINETELKLKLKNEIKATVD